MEESDRLRRRPSSSTTRWLLPRHQGPVCYNQGQGWGDCLHLLAKPVLLNSCLL